ncbi:MAG TPA: O-antigen ligase family protein [Sphingopyxis sp.]|nr:O-antigen ligase family protein [Sphingopyxis sp.]
MFLTGGGSRSDIASLPLLRGGAVLFACWAMVGLQRADWRRVRVPLILLLALTTWTAIQLIPLSPSIWHNLPGRELIVAADRLLGNSDLWRPITLTPSETWNSLLAMTVPLAALMVAARLGPEDMHRILLALLAIAIVNAVLGLLQIAWGAGSPAYLYRITNTGSMVGLFANRNHHGVFQACAILFAATLLRDELMRRQQRPAIQAGLAGTAVLCTIMTMLIGSRAGLAAGAVAFVLSYAMLLPAWRGRPGRDDHRRSSKSRASWMANWMLIVPPLLVAGLLAAILLLADRSTSLSRVAENRVAEDLRVLAWPTIQQMIETYWVTGAGMGSFPAVYRIFESDALLQPAYFNRAHNDWVEILITGGLPSALIIVGAGVWFLRAAVRGGLRNLIKGYRGDYRLPILSMVGLFAAASVVDYPLRTPSLQAMTLILIVLFACPRTAALQRE